MGHIAFSFITALVAAFLVGLSGAGVVAILLAYVGGGVSALAASFVLALVFDQDTMALPDDALLMGRD